MGPYGIDIIEKMPEMQNILTALKQGETLSLSNLNAGLKGFLSYLIFSELKENILILTTKDFSTAVKEYTFPGEEGTITPVVFSPEPIYAFFADEHSREDACQRMSILENLLHDEKGILLSSAEALLKKLPEIGNLKKEFLRLRPGDRMEHGELIEQLMEMGYTRCVQVESRGQFAVRGGLIDVFSTTANQPWRFDFFDNEIENIRSFDCFSQRSVQILEEAMIAPAKDHMEMKNVSGVSLFDYLGNCIIILDEPDAIDAAAQEFLDELFHEMDRLIIEGEISPDLKEKFLSVEELKAIFKHYPQLKISAFESSTEGARKMDLHTLGIESINGQLSVFQDYVRRKVEEGEHIFFCCRSHQSAEKMPDFLKEQALSDLFSPKGPGISIENSEVFESFELPSAGLIYLNERAVFSKKEKGRKRRRFKGRKIDSFTQLSPGDYVVHDVQGIGIYRGVEQIEINGSCKDLMVIEYAGNDRFYLPIEQMDAVQAYIGSGTDHKPKINQLGTTAWMKAKSRARKAVEDMADELIALYAKRRSVQGYAFGPDTVWQREFEEAFVFEETEDQLRCADEIKGDMEKSSPMDRLLCGDVGYGKTEVALRAAFKAIMEGKQVAFLVPTTILAQQHYDNVVERFKGYPIEIAVMSRYRSSKEQNKTIQDMKSGKVDFLIGTHRLLSQDIGFKDLGLLIIDEEQRFGVRAKEKIKSLKTSIDVLTLSATPIPRTLHMSMSGMRDMSVIEEPPYGRKPVQTYVMRYNPIIISDAIHRELARGGQVYYVHNRVYDIEETALQVQKLVSNAKIVTAHGQMTGPQLEKIMKDFLEHRYDILVTTTIIESGMDIANANTLIVDMGDRFGLSQLYQLRGRVGRSKKQAYCYVTHRKQQLTETAEKRLQAIKDFTAFGSGFKIAMRDLEIRGAGNILGAEQSGHLFNIGYEMYCRILEETIQSKTEGKTTKHVENPVKITLDMDAYVPENYIKDEVLKFDIYKKISYVRSDEDYQDLKNELVDRFGKVPLSVCHLMMISRVKYLAGGLGISEIRQRDNEIFFYFEEAEHIPVPDVKMIYQLYEKYQLKLKALKNKDHVWSIQLKSERSLQKCEEIIQFLMMI